ncbi:MAG: hypothetical protein A2381_00500 [Bdellovibrionales bacterium RIFOXYB1_FULL_37_110]|nr:MAG: hypothetical protein A2417_11555 [Bdellovibrionales bacterium RIFOXYC1_FULL_37_79]OFZ53078.1 MAG: hypothetical protein A2328_05310 [Bdellovibrionales bacterium RIFOXYB2_FULL_36_6]OFZ60873.1 MAG: hypothetical protein A2381_00500 [Bdellovibrionales bacterium RIFOXYB1_FULL_37_110]OFZ62403.1 MAG: hypothetical protein A2577_03165 [Bdellovibrionales bacterium RIFOXYD1_FULL_36_51]
MAEFNKKYLDNFLGTVRKYMQMRGALSQKDLADLTDVGVSTMSRFLNQKTRDIDPQLIARIVSKLDIPIHEIIDFVEEDYADRFIRLVKFFKGEETIAPEPEPIPTAATSGENHRRSGEDRRKGPDRRATDNRDNDFVEDMSDLDKKTESQARKDQLGIREKLSRLTPRQKAFLTDFLDSDVAGRDLIVDLGNSIFRYTRQKGIQF